MDDPYMCKRSTSELQNIIACCSAIAPDWYASDAITATDIQSFIPASNSEIWMTITMAELGHL